jgi:hypothetical protein
MALINVEVKGIQPLLMHSPAGIDPTHPLARQQREITKKGKKKTDSDLAELDRIGFELGLYWNGQYVYVPDTAILGVLRAGAAEARLGKDVQAGVDIVESEVPLIYDGPKTPDALYAARFVDRRPAGVQKARVMRTRPRFNSWGLRFQLLIDDAVMNAADVLKALQVAGLRKGLLDFRPRFGRFEVTEWKEQK